MERVFIDSSDPSTNLGGTCGEPEEIIFFVPNDGFPEPEFESRWDLSFHKRIHTFFPQLWSSHFSLELFYNRKALHEILIAFLPIVKYIRWL